MISDSYSWKRDLLRRKSLLEKYSASVLTDEEDNYAYMVLEKAVFYSAFIIRKLIECKTKVSDRVDNHSIRVKQYSTTGMNIHLLRKINADSHDWTNGKAITVNGRRICNSLIHSYLFAFGYGESGKVEGFFVSGDRDRNKWVYYVNLADWIRYIDIVGHDSIVEMSLHFNEKEKDYVAITKKNSIPSKKQV